MSCGIRLLINNLYMKRQNKPPVSNIGEGGKSVKIFCNFLIKSRNNTINISYLPVVFLTRLSLKSRIHFYKCKNDRKQKYEKEEK